MPIDMENTTGCGERYLFHYTSPSGLAGIILNGSLRYSPLSRMNDPRESKPIQFGFRDVHNLTHQQSIAAHAVAKTVLYENTQLICLSGEGIDPSPDGSFSRGWGRARSWAMYAAEHRGACLVFDRERLVQSAIGAANSRGLKDLRSGWVTYEDRQSLDWDTEWAAVGSTDLDEVRSTAYSWRGAHWNELYLRKSTDWSSEREFRFIGFSDQQLTCPIADALEAIILGESFPPEEMAVLGPRLFQLGVTRTQIGMMQWLNGTPGAYRLGECTQSSVLAALARSELPGMKNGPAVEHGWSDISPTGRAL